ncbi:hypothetical protein J3R83DRAFT_6009 [Lanmaoa asiatica]|nr:hypothetical protein J3R83DRAFT_6009 [Lanmaoa asiatica]
MARLPYPRFEPRINNIILLPLASLLALALPLVSALTFKTPTDVVSGRATKFSWTLDGDEPSVYEIVLGGPATQVLGTVKDPKQTSITAVPQVPAGYVLLTSDSDDDILTSVFEQRWVWPSGI